MTSRVRLLALTTLLAACARSGSMPDTARPAPAARSDASLPVLPVARSSAGERVHVLALTPAATATIVLPARIDPARRVDLILYTLPNGNSTAETMGRRLRDSSRWRDDIQHIAAQTRFLRTRGLTQAIVVYLEADARSWPEWRRVQGYPTANARLVALVDELRAQVARLAGHPRDMPVTLTGHSGGGSFMFGWMEGLAAQGQPLPAWLVRIAWLDANYNFAATHGPMLRAWLQGDTTRVLEVLAYDDREIMLDGKKVVADDGGTWRASQRLLTWLATVPEPVVHDTLGVFRRWRAMDGRLEVLLHPNPANRILHTALVGEMNGYAYTMLVRRPGALQQPGEPRVYSAFVDTGVTLPPAVRPPLPPRARDAEGATAFFARVRAMPRQQREAAVQAQLLAGNIPSFLRALRDVTVTATLADGSVHTATFAVMPDYLAIGRDDDWARIPTTPQVAQAFGDAYGFVLPTRKMVNDIWRAATVHGDPRPLTIDRDSAQTVLQHHRLVEAQLRDTLRAPVGAFVAGIKKDVVVTPLLRARTDRVAIFGWHYVDGRPIQPLYTGHVDWYVDYSHGIRLVSRIVTVDGVRMPIERVLADPLLHVLLSDEGPVRVARYQP
ncbi:MAG: hypothetical protein LCH84_01995 [Gemmatimonadetes bacterium]|nr:hypothetical protein [Gemmatimonadota bacterium]